MLASAAPHGVAFADGAGPAATMYAIAATGTSPSDMVRRIPDKVTPFQERDASLDVRSWLM
jgi:hypothetical protein